MADYHGSFAQQNAEQRVEDAFISARKRAEMFKDLIEGEDLQREVQETATVYHHVILKRLGLKPLKEGGG